MEIREEIKVNDIIKYTYLNDRNENVLNYGIVDDIYISPSNQKEATVTILTRTKSGLIKPVELTMIPVKWLEYCDPFRIPNITDSIVLLTLKNYKENCDTSTAELIETINKYAVKTNDIPKENGISNYPITKIVSKWKKEAKVINPVGYNLKYVDDYLELYIFTTYPGKMVGYHGKLVDKYKDEIKNELGKTVKIFFEEEDYVVY